MKAPTSIRSLPSDNAAWSQVAAELGERRAVRSQHGEHLSVDERSALCLLAMARNLLAAEHSAVAGMIDYAMIEVAQGLDR